MHGFQFEHWPSRDRTRGPGRPCPGITRQYVSNPERHVEVAAECSEIDHVAESVGSNLSLYRGDREYLTHVTR